MSNLHSTQVAINDQLKRVQPALNDIAGSIQAIKDASIDDMRVLENVIRIATKRILDDAQIEHDLVKANENMITDENNVVWNGFIKALLKARQGVVHDVDLTYIKSKFYPVFTSTGGESHEYLRDLTLELELIETRRVKEKSDVNWFDKVKAWFKPKAKPVAQKDSNNAAIV